MKIPFTKAHGARNDFLLTFWPTWTRNEPRAATADFAAIARAICDRHTGIGADGWLLVDRPLVNSFINKAGGFADEADSGVDGRIDLWNSDGSTSPISGNGTRCAAAFLVEARVEAGQATDLVRIATGAGVKDLTLLGQERSGDGHKFLFEMNMGSPDITELHANVQGHDAVILDVGNPQCAVLVENFDFDWQSAGAAIESDPRFPNRTNVSFIRVLDPHTLEVQFFERGAGVTMSSGTGSTGAAAAASARGLSDGQVEVQTLAGPLQLRWKGEDILLAGPAEIIGNGEFYLEKIGG